MFIGACDIDYIRFINTHFIDGEKFLDYCTESDFVETVYIGDRLTVFTENLHIQGVLFDVDAETDTFKIVHGNDKTTLIKCSDVIAVVQE